MVEAWLKRQVMGVVVLRRKKAREGCLAETWHRLEVRPGSAVRAFTHLAWHSHTLQAQSERSMLAAAFTARKNGGLPNLE